MERHPAFAGTGLSGDTGFSPSLTVKHNSKKELSVNNCTTSINMFLMEDYARQIGVDIQNSEMHSYLNPYAFEINRDSIY